MGLEKFEYENVRSTMNGIESIGDNIKSLLSDCQAEMDANIGNISTWSGEAATSVKGKWDKCSSNFDSFIREIHNMSAKLDKAGKGFKKFEDSRK